MNLVERCFDTCATSFRSKTLNNYESTCIENCAERYIATRNRTALRFQEHQATFQQNMQQQQQQQQGAAAGIGGGLNPTSVGK